MAQAAAGLASFRKTIAKIRAAAAVLHAGGKISGPEEASLLGRSANEFEQALRDRRALMRQLRRIDPENAVLRQISARDQ